MSAPGRRFATTHIQNGNPHARKRCTFRTGNKQGDAGTAHPARLPRVLSGTPSLVSQDFRALFLRLSRGAAQNIHVKSPRAPTSAADGLRGVVPAVGTSAPSVLPPSQVIISTTQVRAHSAAPIDNGPSSAKGIRAPSAVPIRRGSNSAMGARTPNAVPINHDKGSRHLARSPQARVD